MASDARRATVGDYVALVRGTTYKGQLVGEPGPALLGLGSIEPGGGFRTGNYKTYGGDCPDELMLFPGHIYASLKGATKDGKMIGSVARVPPSVPTGRLTQDTVKLVFRTPDPEDATYLYWVLRTPQYRDYCAGHAMGSAVVALSRRDFLSYPVPPPTTERRRVVTLLDAIEEKTELNRRMNETLEAMARALFKSWFVDFDPVRAKSEGRDPGLPEPIADLFPARLVDSELNGIPEGWQVAPLPEVVEVNPTRALRKGVEAPYLDMANMPTRGHSADEVIDRAFGSGMRFIKGDTLVARITPCLENGKTAFVDFLQEGQVGWGSTEYIVLRPKAPLPEEYGYCLARSAEFREFAIQSMTGTSGRQRVPAELLAHFRVAVPPKPIAEAFGRAVKPRFARASAAVREARTLAALRDALLPMLISGDLRATSAVQHEMDRVL